MIYTASGFLGKVNDVIDSREVVTGLLVALIAGVAGLVFRAYRQRRRVSWTTLYDEPINQGPTKPAGPNMWEISWQGRQIEEGSLVVLEVQNTGGEHIEEKHWAVPMYFTFPGRKVEHFKVRDAGDLYQLIHPDPQTLPGSDPSRIALPALPLNRKSSFKLLVLLTGLGTTIKDGGYLRSGHIARSKSSWRIRIMVGTAVAALLVGTTGGVWLANRVLDPVAVCANGTLTVEGSTAFAPIATEVKNAYEQSCPNAAITVVADGSRVGVDHLSANGSTSTIAMSDGRPAQPVDAKLNRHAAGVVLFAVVANRQLRSTKPELFQDSSSVDALRTIFRNPARSEVVVVGRTADSGTRATFDSTVLRSEDPASADAPSCPPATTQAAPPVCTVKTTMDLLRYVDSTPNAIGYAEADALSFFPNVEVVPINGARPTRDDALAGRYPFVATEYLYTAGKPTDLTADYLQFLTGDAMTARLRGHGYIGCSELSGTKLDGACTD